MLGAALSAFAVVAAVAVLSLVFGLVLLRLLRAWLVDGTLEFHEGVLLVAGLIASMGSIITLWGSPLMILPALLAGGGYIGWQVRLKRSEVVAEAGWDDREEAKARSILARDPTAIIGYEKLSEVLLKRGRREEALEVMTQWQAREPGNKHLRRRVRELTEQLASPPLAEGWEAVPVDPMVQQRREHAPKAEAEVEPEPELPVDFGPPAEPVAAFDFGPDEPETDPSVTETVESTMILIGGERAEDFAPGSRAFDEQALAFDPDATAEPPADGFNTDPAALTGEP